MLNLNTIIKTKSNNHYIIFIYTVVYLYIIFSPVKLVNDLDPSWQFSINHAIANNRNFGSEIIFTYGPLGYLFYGLNEGLLSIHILYKYLYQLLNLFVFLNIISEIYNHISQIYCNKLLKTLLKYILIPFTLLKVSIFSDFSLIVFVNIIYAYNLVLKEKFNNKLFNKLIILLFISFWSNVLFFGKISYSIFLIYFSILYLIFEVINRNYILSIIFILQVTLIFCLIKYTTNINLIGYIQNSIEIIIGYKQSMIIDLVNIGKNTRIKYYLFYTISIIYFTYLLFKIFKYHFVISKEFNALLFGNLINIASLYYFFSYSFSRGVGSLIFGTPLIIFILFLILKSNSNLIKQFLPVIYCTLALHTISFLYLTLKNNRNYSNSISQNETINKLTTKGNALSKHKYETFDIYPYLSSIAFYEKLHYIQRPLIQNYVAFTNKLDLINSNFFSKRKVDNIIFHTSKSNITWGGANLLGNSIDNRYFMFDEPNTKIEILKNYENPISIGDSLFFVHRKNTPDSLKFIFFKRVYKKINSIIEIDQINDELIFATFDFKIKNQTKLFSLLHNIPNLFIEFEMMDGEKFRHQVVVDLLKGPVLINYYCFDYYDFFNIKKDFKKNRKVKKIKFFQSYNGYNEDININFYKAKIN